MVGGSGASTEQAAPYRRRIGGGTALGVRKPVLFTSIVPLDSRLTTIEFYVGVRGGHFVPETTVFFKSRTHTEPAAIARSPLTTAATAGSQQ